MKRLLNVLVLLLLVTLFGATAQAASWQQFDSGFYGDTVFISSEDVTKGDKIIARVHMQHCWDKFKDDKGVVIFKVNGKEISPSNNNVYEYYCNDSGTLEVTIEIFSGGVTRNIMVPPIEVAK